MAALLHAAVALAVLWELPRTQAEAAEQAIEFTVDVPVPAPPESPPQQAAAAAPPPAAQPPSVPPSPPAAPPPRLGLAPPRSLTPDPNSRPDVPPGPTSSRPTRTTEPAREPAREPPKPEPPKPEPEQQQAAAAPPPPPPPPEMKLEQALPPLDAPPPPLSAQDFPKIAPPPPPKAPPPPQQRAQTPPPPQQRQPLQPSPLAGGQQQRPPADSQAAARPAPSPLTNPAGQYGQRKAEEDYLWRVAQKLSQHQQFVKNVSTESGSVVMRFIIARDGSLVDVGIFKSSGLPSLDASAISMIRQAAPYPPLPADIAGARQSFLLPLQFRRSD